MRFIHTADWHLGFSLYGTSMIEDQAYILNQFIDIIQSEQPDFIIIAGDLFDRTVPSADAINLLDYCLSTISLKLKVPLFIISGNHDCSSRLEFGSKLFQTHQLFVRTKLEEDIFSPLTIQTSNANSPDIFLLPFTDIVTSRHFYNDPSIVSSNQVMHKAVQRMADVSRSQIAIKNILPKRRILVAHTTVEGGIASESERILGFNFPKDSVKCDVFQNQFDYVALGHLHKPQTIGSTYSHGPVIRYPGSILKYSFSEVNDHKSVTLVDLGNDSSQLIAVKEIPLIPHRDLKVIKGYFNDLLKMGEGHPDSHNYIGIELLDTNIVLDAAARLRRVFPYLLNLKRQSIPTAEFQSKDNLQETSAAKLLPSEVFQEFYQHVTGENINEAQKKELLSLFTNIQKASH